MTVTFDSSAWVEYFAGTDLGRNVKKYVDGMETIYTPTIDLLEIKSKYDREKKKWKDRIDFICERSTIVDIDRNIALLAADLKKDFGLYSIDAIIYAAARLKKSKLLTKDGHFEGLKNVIMLK